MRVSLFPAPCVTSLLVVLGVANLVTAQEPPAGVRQPAASRPAPSGTNVAVVDVSLIFKHHNKFNTQLASLNERGSELDAWVRSQQRALAKMREDLGTYKAGSPEYQQLEEKITKAIADNDLNLRRQRQDFLADEAKLYYETYAEIEQAIIRFSLQRNIGLVLRHSREQPKVEDPKSVMQNISRFVIYNNGLDITNIILDQLNAGVPAPPAATKTGAVEGVARPPAGTQPGRTRLK